MTAIETILNAVPGSFREWSVVWSTGHVPMMDAGYGGDEYVCGRRNLRLAALLFAFCLSVQCRVVAAFISGGGLLYAALVIIFVLVLAGPMRYFELYVGQWSLSGPGRAFRFTPILDGIGLAMGAVCIVRAVVYSCIAASTLVYVWHATFDYRLPFTYCEDPEEPKGIMCPRNFTTTYPLVPLSPEYNFYYIEVMKVYGDKRANTCNHVLMIAVIVCWAGVLLLMIREKFLYRKLVWNNVQTWLVLIPVCWVLTLLVFSLSNVKSQHITQFLIEFSELDNASLLTTVSDALEISLHIHAAGLGTEIIVGKGLNHFAAGHIDPNLNSDNVVQSLLVVLLCIAHAFATVVCAAGDTEQRPRSFQHMYQHGARL